MKYHNYIFLQTNHSFLQMSAKQRTTLIQTFIKQINDNKTVVVNTFATIGLKQNTNCLLWLQSEKVEDIQNFLNTLFHSPFAKHLRISHTLFGTIHGSQYSLNTGTQLDTNWKGAKYLIIYPFTKTHEWYMLDFSKRKQLMQGHIAIGKKFPQIAQLLLYSYGIDDQEFIVSYETNDLLDFQKLVIELRADKVREFTKSDTPIFTCIHKTLEEFVTFL